MTQETVQKQKRRHVHLFTPLQTERAASAPALQPPQRMPAIHMLERIRHQSCVICAMLAPYTPPSTPCASLCRRLPPAERILGWLGSKRASITTLTVPGRQSPRARCHGYRHEEVGKHDRDDGH